MNEVLIISDVGPTREFTGGLVLHNIAGALSYDFKFDWFILHDQKLGDYKLDSFSSETVFYSINKPSENWADKKYLFGFNILGERISKFDFESAWQDINEIISCQNYSKIVVVLQGQTSFRIAAKLQQNKITFSTLNWDPWIWWALHKNVPSSFTSIVENVYKNLSKGKHMVPTLEFAERYKIPIADVVVLYPHIKQNFVEMWESESKSGESEKRLSIELGFAGQIYAKNEFDLLLHELDNLDWKIANLPVRLHYFGTSQKINHSNIINHGWVEPSMLISELSKLDIGILAYPALENIPEVSNLSFPSKFATYCAAGIPTVYIGPANTPVSKMIIKDTGFHTSGTQQEICLMIEHCFNNRRVIKEKVRDRYVALFSDRAFLESLTRVFGLSKLNPNNNHVIQTLQLSSLLQIGQTNYSNVLTTFTDWKFFLRKALLAVYKLKRLFFRIFLFARKLLNWFEVKSFSVFIFIGMLFKYFIRRH
jgi:hypothetical protein